MQFSAGSYLKHENTIHPQKWNVHVTRSALWYFFQFLQLSLLPKRCEVYRDARSHEVHACLGRHADCVVTPKGSLSHESHKIKHSGSRHSRKVFICRQTAKDGGDYLNDIFYWTCRWLSFYLQVPTQTYEGYRNTFFFYNRDTRRLIKVLRARVLSGLRKVWSVV